MKVESVEFVGCRRLLWLIDSEILRFQSKHLRWEFCTFDVAALVVVGPAEFV